MRAWPGEFHLTRIARRIEPLTYPRTKLGAALLLLGLAGSR